MLSRIDLERARESGTLEWGSGGTLEDASVNLSVGEVWTMRKTIALPPVSLDSIDKLSLRTILKRHYDPKPVDPETGAWKFVPDEFCLGVLKQPLRLSKGMFGMIQSRSSYARLGLAINHADDDFQFGTGFDGKLCVSIKPYTHCLLYPDEQPVQLTVEDPPIHLVDSTPLSLDAKIMIYDGETVISKRDRESIAQAFSAFILPPDGFVFPEEFTGKFFLASTRETVEIGKDRVGFLPYSLGGMDEPYPPITLHTHAPWIMPGDRLTITLECQQKFSERLYPGMAIPSLTYRPLNTPLEKSKGSKYHGQSEVTLTR